MSEKHWLILWVICSGVVLAWLGSGYLSREARLERRRRKSHSRIISKSGRPSVKFSVKAPAEKNKRHGKSRK